MIHPSRTTHAATLLAIFVAAPAALAQVAPPPPAKPDPTPEYVRPDAVPVAPKNLRSPVNVEDVQYTPLVQIDSDGTIIRLTLPADFAALERNPLIDDDTRIAMRSALDDRRARVEANIVSNASTMVEVDAGLLETIQGIASNDEEGQLRLQAVQEMIRPLLVGVPLGEDLRALGVLDDRQAALNDKIGREYKSALLEEVRDNFSPKPGDPVSQVDLLLREAFAQQLAEPVWTYHQMLLAASEDIQSAIRVVSLDEQQQGRVRPIVRALEAATTDQGRLNLMRDLMAILSPTQQRELLQFAANLDN